jgi:putative transcriptional regulator
MRNDVAARRGERGWSQARLADALGVSRQTVISIEKGHYDPSLPLAFRLAGLFDCPIEDLFHPEPDPAPGLGPAGRTR